MSYLCLIFANTTGLPYISFFLFNYLFMQLNKETFLKTLGPGILFASTCVGVSHLVQSTRAGADYGFYLIGIVILANIIKYPFFEFASRYTNATGKSILDGYYQQHKGILWLYLLVTTSTMFIVSAAIVFVTAGLLSNLFPFELQVQHWGMVVFVICIAILTIGKYSTLDKLLKVVGTVLVISTLAAFVSALFIHPVKSKDFIPKELQTTDGLIFIIALMGWMPTAVDMSSWNSLWTEARIQQTKYHPTLKETLLDFNLGYWVSAVLAIFFLSLGALVIYGTGTELSNSSPTFAHQLITMYTSAIGDWSYYIIAIAAFSTMFSTSITVIDGYSRAISRASKLLRNQPNEPDNRKFYMGTVFILATGSYLVISVFLGQLKTLVDAATIVSFVIAPLAGYFNYRIIYSNNFPNESKPPVYKKRLAQLGILFLSIFTIIFFFVKFY